MFKVLKTPKNIRFENMLLFLSEMFIIKIISPPLTKSKANVLKMREKYLSVNELNNSNYTNQVRI